MTESPWLDSSATLRWMSALAPTSIPRVGSSRMISSGAVASQRASSTFCWLPPERVPTRALGSAGRTPRARMYSVTTASYSARRSLRCQPRRAWMPSAMFSPTVRSATMPSACRFSEENAIRWPIACRGEAIRSRLAVELDLAGVGPVGAVEQPDQLGPSRSRGARRSRRPRRRRRRRRPAPGRRAGPRRSPAGRVSRSGRCRARRSPRWPRARRSRARPSWSPGRRGRGPWRSTRRRACRCGAR